MSKGTETRPGELGTTTAHGTADRDRKEVGRPTWAFSPTDLTFLWDECPCCFYNKVVLKQSRPKAPFPKVFGLIDRAMKDCYLGQRAEELVPGMGPGVIMGGDRWVK